MFQASLSASLAHGSVDKSIDHDHSLKDVSATLQDSLEVTTSKRGTSQQVVRRRHQVNFTKFEGSDTARFQSI